MTQLLPQRPQLRALLSRFVHMLLHMAAWANRLGQSAHFVIHVPLTGSVHVSVAAQVVVQPPQRLLS